MPRLDYEKAKAYRREWGRRNKAKLQAYMREWQGYPQPTRPCPETCECCGRPATPTKALALDHDHETNSFRGWLCDNCNRGLGQIGDTLDAARRLVAYLERANTVASNLPHG